MMETFKPRERRGDKKRIEGKKESRDLSDDSIPSVILPERRCSFLSAQQHQLQEDESESDMENYEALNLYIFFSVILQFLTSCGMICISIVFITLNYRHSLLGDLQVNLSVYLFQASGLLFLLGSYLTSLNHNFRTIPILKHLICSMFLLAANILSLVGLIMWGLKMDLERKEIILQMFNDSFMDYNISVKAHNFMNDVQNELDCCGVNSKADWEVFEMNLPKSCCRKFSSNEVCVEWKHKGCYKVYYAVKYSFIDFTVGFSSIALVIAVIAMIPLIVTCCYARRKKKKFKMSAMRRERNDNTLNNTRENSREIIRTSPNITDDISNGVTPTADNTELSRPSLKSITGPQPVVI